MLECHGSSDPVVANRLVAVDHDRVALSNIDIKPVDCVGYMANPVDLSMVE